MSSTKYEIRLLRLAEEDLTEIILYVAAERPSAALNLTNRFDKRLKSLADNPRLGSVPHEVSLRKLDYRYLVVDDYLIFYTVEEKIVYIHRIVHGARNYTNLL
jgi:toxin ParE1/3/4